MGSPCIIAYATKTQNRRTMSMKRSKVFYLHTDPIEPGYNIGYRATVACAHIRGAVWYGIAICSSEDNFDRSKGRELALERLEQGFGMILDNGHFAKYETEDDLLFDTAARLASSVSNKWEKYKRKLEAFKESFTEEPEVELTIAHVATSS